MKGVQELLVRHLQRRSARDPSQFVLQVDLTNAGAGLVVASAPTKITYRRVGRSCSSGALGFKFGDLDYRTLLRFHLPSPYFSWTSWAPHVMTVASSLTTLATMLSPPDELGCGSDTTSFEVLWSTSPR